MFDFFSSTMFRYIGRVFRSPMGWIPYLMVKKWMILVYSTGIISLYLVITNKAVKEKLVIAENILVGEMNNVKSIAQNCTTFAANGELDKLWQCIQRHPEYKQTEFDNKVFGEEESNDNTANNNNDTKFKYLIEKDIINDLNMESNNAHDTVRRLKDKSKQLYDTSNTNLGHHPITFELNRDLYEKELDQSYEQISMVKESIIKRISSVESNKNESNKELLDVFNKTIDQLTLDLKYLLELAVDNLVHREDEVLSEEDTVHNKLNSTVEDLKILANTDNSTTHEKNIDKINKLKEQKEYFESQIYIIEKKKQEIHNKKSKLKEQIDKFNANIK